MLSLFYPYQIRLTAWKVPLLSILGLLLFTNSLKAIPWQKLALDSTIQDSLIYWKGQAYRVVIAAPTQLQFFLNDAQGKRIRSFDRLDQVVKAQGKQLIFGMNGGMYLPTENNAPQGLYIENGKVLKVLDPLIKQRPIRTNFYLHPNGVFYISKTGNAYVQANASFQANYPKEQYADIKYATQSGPMLVIDGAVHPVFTPNSKHIHLRNGVGILPDGRLALVISEDRVCFYDLATLFKDRLHCQQALYLDGFISKLYYPKLPLYQALPKGTFGVLMGIVN